MDEPQKRPSPAPPPSSALRMIDANYNRASEGLRVVEDYCRFDLNDPHLTSRFKSLRHNLTTALAAVPLIQRLTTRETQQDVGAILTTPQEQTRDSLPGIAAAACHRVQQALRVIEECLKLFDTAAAAKVESLRYQTYTLAKACLTTATSRDRLAAARLYVLIDGNSSEGAFVDQVQTLIAAGVDILQLRDKHLDDRTLLARARLLRKILDEKPLNESKPLTPHPSPLTPPSPLLILNDRPDIALLARADGVHVGQEELPVHEVRQIVGPQLLIGVSTHNLDQARQAVLGGANYLGCGPVFPSQTKHFHQFPGLDFLNQVAAQIALPAFAIGGINENNLPQVLETGFRRVAVSSAITAAADATKTTRWFKSALTI